MKRLPILVLHYSEVWLKGCNRPFFVSKLREAVQRNLAGLAVRYDRHVAGRLVLRAETEEAAQEAAERLRRTPGIQNIGLGYACEPELDAIVEIGAELMRGSESATFAVRAKRSTKQLPFRSLEVERVIGERILREARESGGSLAVDLDHPQSVCWVEATSEEAFIYSDKTTGCGGLPTNTGGRLGCLLSGGIDSAAAAYKIIRRGVKLTFVHFWGAPARPGEESASVAREIVKQLTLYQGRSRLYLVPFDDIQKQVVISAPEEFRLLIYRRLMLRICERLGRFHDGRGTVTGDCISQVASQTLRNMEAIEAVARHPIYRPLCGDDKQEIIALARRIGTYDISNQPFTDCCPMYLPKSPRIFSSVQELDQAESHLEIDRLVEQGLQSVRREIYEYERGEVVLKSVREREQAA